MFPKVNNTSSVNDWRSEIKPTLFDVAHNVDSESAIDLFIQQNRELNKIIIDPTGKLNSINQLITDGEISQEEGRKVLALLSQPIDNSKFYNLILLGYISAVEAYFRKLIKDLINLDSFCQENCQMKLMNFGATYYQTKDKYPESLMEGISLAKSSTIISNIKDLLGINIQITRGSSLSNIITHFDSLCQLRHCIIHRFGNIGVTNIIELGIHNKEHMNCIEKPITLNHQSIQKASKVTSNLVRELNHEIWIKIMTRLAKDPNQFWKWDLRKDKKIFNQYLGIFFETTDVTIEDSSTEIYNEYRKEMTL